MANRILITSHGTNREAFSSLDWVLFVSLSAIWGSSFLFMAIGLDAFHPGLVTFLRVGFGACFLAMVPKARRTSLPREELPRIGLLGLIWVAAPFTLFPLAQQWIDSAVAGMLNGATPIFTAVVATALLRKLPDRLHILGLVIGLTGIVAIALPSSGEGTTQAIGVVLVLVATVCYAFATNIVAPLQQLYGSLPVIARMQWIAVILVAPYGVYGLAHSRFSTASLLAVAAVGVVNTGLALVMMGTLVGSVGATRSTFITYLIPVVALVLGVAFRDERVAPVTIMGVALVIAGAILASRRESPAPTEGLPSGDDYR